MNVVSHAVDPLTAQRLRARRIVVVDAEASRAQAFARALQQYGAVVATISPGDTDHDAAHALDADVLLVNEDESEACRALVLALRENPRTRWSTVLPVSFTSLWPSDAEQPDVALVADQVNDFATALVELTVRAKGKLPHDASLEPLGPSRSLRALGSIDRSLRIVLSDMRMHAELELTEGRVGGVRAWIAGAQEPFHDAEALSAALAISSGQLHIEELGEPALSSWNIELTVALASAAAIVQERGPHPTVPQLSFADILAEANARGRALNVSSAREPEPKQQPTPAIEPTPPHAPTLSSAAATGETDEPSTVDTRAGKTKPRRSRASAIAFALLCTTALALALYTRWYDVSSANGERSVSYAGSLATALAHSGPRPRPAFAAAPPQPLAAQPITPAELPAAAVPTLDATAQAAPAPRELSRSEREQVKRISKRAHSYLRAKRYATAATAYSKVLALDSRHVVAMRALVRIHLHERNVEEGLRWALQLAQLEPDSAVSQLLLGDVQALSGNAALAEQAWQRASTLGSDAASKRMRHK